jgi:hypothetical protein
MIPTAMLPSVRMRLRKIAESDYSFMSVRTEQLGSHWTDFHEI